MPSERAGVDPLHARNIPAREIIFERQFRTPIARHLAQFFDDKSADVGLTALLVERVRAVIADKRIGHRDDLASVRGISQHFLVTGHRSVETNFSDPSPAGAKRFAFENPAIFKSENRAHARAVCRLTAHFQMLSRTPSFPNSVWERTCLRNSVSQPGATELPEQWHSQTEFGNEGIFKQMWEGPL